MADASSSPNDTPDVKCAGIRALGAELIVHDAAGYDAAEREARRLAAERNATFASAFDDPWVQAGNGGTVALEIMEQAPETGRIIVPVGRGRTRVRTGVGHPNDVAARRRVGCSVGSLSNT
jgi:threonine dehydratase